VLLNATTIEPTKCLGSEAEGKAWLYAAAQVYAQRVGISLSSGGGSGSFTGSSSGGAIMNSGQRFKLGWTTSGTSTVTLMLEVFSPFSMWFKLVIFDSSWNWVRQDAMLMFYDILFGHLTTVDCKITACCVTIMDRADPYLTKFMEVGQSVRSHQG
jgi:fatty acid synthase subunit alpha